MKYIRILILLTSCFLLHFTVYAQKVSFQLGTGIGSYQMSELKELTNQIKENIPFQTELASDFPIYWNYEAALMLELKKINFGLAYGFQSTGNHLSQGDYSGNYNMKMNVKSHAPALRTEFVPNQGNIQICLYSLIGLHISTLDMSEQLTVYDQELLNESYQFKSTDGFWEPGIKASYNFKFLDFSLSGGYHIQPTHQELKSAEDTEFELKNPESGNKIGLNWSGYRLLASIGIKFNKN